MCIIDPDAAIILSVTQKLLDKRAKNPENFFLIILEVCWSYTVAIIIIM